MKVLFLFLLVCVSCATRTPVTDTLVRNGATSAEVKGVPLIKQKEHHCGPATLAMVMQYHGKKITTAEVAKGLFHKKLKGSFFPEMKARAREEGFLVLEVNDLKKVFEELRAGSPLIVLQNNGFGFFPQWHFAVLRGMDFDGPDVFLHDGNDEVHRMDMRLFERSFVLGGRRALVLLPPHKLSNTGTELEHVEAAAMLEALGKVSEANLSYLSILMRWPRNAVALIGASNTHYSLGRKQEAREVLQRSNLESAIILHNLAILESETGSRKRARSNARKALDLADKNQKEKFLVSLKELL